MRHIYTNNVNVEGLLNDNNTTIAKFFTLEETEPDHYFHTFLVDVVNVPLADYVLTEEQLKAQNPTWCEKYWPLVKQMDDAGCWVYLWSYRWFVYIGCESKFEVCSQPDFDSDAMIVAGDPVTLSFHVKYALETLFGCMLFLKNIVEDDVVSGLEFVATDLDNFKQLCKKLAQLLKKEKEVSEFWFQKTGSLVCDYGCYMCEDKWTTLEKHFSLYDKEYKEFNSYCNHSQCCYLKCAFRE